MPGRLHGPRPPRVVLLRPCGRPASPARACSAPDATRTTWSSSSHPALRRSAATSGPRSAPREHLRSGGRRDRRRLRRRGGRLVLEPARTLCSREALAAGGRALRSCRAELGADAGMIGAASSRSSRSVGGGACRSRSARRRSATSRTSRCACSRAREADVVLCEDTRHTRVLLERHGIEARLALATTSTTRRRGRRSCCRGSRRASAWRSCPTPGCPASPIRAARLVRAALEAGVAVTVLPGPSAVETALVASGLVGRAVRVRRLSAAAARRSSRALWEELRRGRGRSSRSSRRSGCRRRCARSPRRPGPRRSRSAAS